jgi:hypothetical protein
LEAERANLSLALSQPNEPSFDHLTEEDHLLIEEPVINPQRSPKTGH